MKLSELQELFTNDVIKSDGAHPEYLLKNVRDTRGVDARTRLDVYRSNIVGLHLNVLDDTFPVIVKVLGERYWHHILGAGIESYSSSTFNLNIYGSFVPELLEKACSERPELADFTYLSDLAKLELAIHQTQFCKNDPSFNWDTFQNLGPSAQSSAKLVTSASLSLFSSASPVDALWYSHQEDLAEQTFSDAADNITSCIYRDNQFKVTLERLSGSALLLLERLVAGASLDELQAENICEPDELIRMIFSLINRGWIVSFKEVR